MRTGDYNQGEKNFLKEVAENPDDASGHYYLGRFLLAQHKYEPAKAQLKKAVILDSQDADHHFWIGITYGHLGDIENERTSYLNTLKLKRDHSQALLNLGHLELKKGKYAEALRLYDKVLAQNSTNPSGLYNRGLALRHLGKTAEEKVAWKEYLRQYPAGYLAGRATDHLNSLGDFSFRNHYLSRRTVTLKEITFASSTSSILSPSSYPSLKVIGATLVNRPKEVLQIVVYHDSSDQVAKERAVRIQEYLQSQFSGIEAHQIRISWFRSPERLQLNKKTFNVKNSVRFFGTEEV
jgi:tetratricopeptide (TPR) repeat protein